MAEKQITFKGFPLDSRGNVIGAFPTVDVIQERSKDLINEVVRNINQMTIDYCLKFNIDPDVLIKQKAEIELLLMKIEKMKCCNNCKHKDLSYSFSPICKLNGYNAIKNISNPVSCKCDKWELDKWELAE